MMNTYKVTAGGNSSRWVGDKKTGRRVRLMRGSDVQLTDAEAKTLPKNTVTLSTDTGAVRTTATAGKVNPVDEEMKAATVAGSASDGAKGDAKTDAAVDDIIGGNANDAIDLIGIEDDADVLNRALAAEKAGKDRKTVVEAIEARLDELA